MDQNKENQMVVLENRRGVRYYIYNSFVFLRINSHRGIIRLRCQWKMCPARATLTANHDILYLDEIHNHRPHNVNL